MEPIQITTVQTNLEKFIDKPVYLHLETTNGAYARHVDEKAYNVGAFIRNAKVTFSHAKIVGDKDSYRVGLKMDLGWIHAEGLTDYHMTEIGQLLLAGHDRQGRLMVALQISEQPFRFE